MLPSWTRFWALERLVCVNVTVNKVFCSSANITTTSYAITFFACHTVFTLHVFHFVPLCRKKMLPCGHATHQRSLTRVLEGMLAKTHTMPSWRPRSWRMRPQPPRWIASSTKTFWTSLLLPSVLWKTPKIWLRFLLEHTWLCWLRRVYWRLAGTSTDDVPFNMWPESHSKDLLLDAQKRIFKAYRSGCPPSASQLPCRFCLVSGIACKLLSGEAPLPSAGLLCLAMVLLNGMKSHVCCQRLKCKVEWNKKKWIKCSATWSGSPSTPSSSSTLLLQWKGLTLQSSQKSADPQSWCIARHGGGHGHGWWLPTTRWSRRLGDGAWRTYRCGGPGDVNAYA